MTPELRQAVGRLPKSPGIYQWKDSAGHVLYVGKAKDLRARARSYLNGPQSEKNRQMLEQAADIDYIAVATNKEALVLEQTLIKRLKPRYNIRLTDDKSYPYIKLTKPPYPRLVKVHGYRPDGGTWFGPFPDGYGAFHVMQALNDLFPLRRCRTLPKVKCLYYDIGKCIAPCIEACTDEEYDQLVAEVKALLRGKSKGILKRLEQRIEDAAANHRFEEAARLRDQLQGLRGVLERQHMLVDRLEDRDVVAIATRGDRAVLVVLHQRDGKVVGQSPFVLAGVGNDDPGEAVAQYLRSHYADRVVPRHVALDCDAETAAQLEEDLRAVTGRAITVETPQRGVKRRWLEVAQQNANLRLEEETLRSSKVRGAMEALRDALGLPVTPNVIEGFDISHQAGAHTRAAMVRFVDAEPDKQGYRTFAMKSVGEAAVAAGASSKGRGREVDDFASIHEAVHRRYGRKRAEGGTLPDLVVIDGGKGQLAAAKQALDDLQLSLPLVSIAKKEEELHVPARMNPIRLPRNHAGLQLVQRVRDEAHRFGITQVRRKASKAVMASPIDPIPGIGPKKRKLLVESFGGLEGLRAASAADLEKVPGITLDLAQQILAVLRD